MITIINMFLNLIKPEYIDKQTGALYDESAQVCVAVTILLICFNGHTEASKFFLCGKLYIMDSLQISVQE